MSINRALVRAIPVAGAVALSPAVAEACPYYNCDAWHSLAPINADLIPADGVLVLQGAAMGAPTLDGIALEVTLDGQPIAGALETTSVFGALVWRPAEPWTPGGAYKLGGSVTPSDYAYCGSAFDIAADLAIDDAAAEELDIPMFDGVEDVLTSPQIDLETLACCEGAGPSYGYGGCGGNYVNWDPNVCAPTKANGTLQVQITGEPVAPDPTAKEIAYALQVDGQPYANALAPNFTVYRDAPFCAEIVATDLGTGASTVSAKQCFGQTVADQLGMQELDPAETLSCPLFQCAPTVDGWDLADCDPLDPSPESATASDTAAGGDKDEDGCACDTGAPPSAYSLAWLALLALVRRRRPPP